MQRKLGKYPFRYIAYIIQNCCKWLMTAYFLSRCLLLIGQIKYILKLETMLICVLVCVHSVPSNWQLFDDFIENGSELKQPKPSISNFLFMKDFWYSNVSNGYFRVLRFRVNLGYFFVLSVFFKFFTMWIYHFYKIKVFIL